MRVLLLHNIVNPHMRPVFEALAHTDGIDLTVAFFAETEADRDWGGGAGDFRAVVLPGRQLNLPLRWDTLSFHVNRGFGRLLAGWDPQVVINAGWMSLTNWHAFLDCRRHHRKHVVWAGSTRHQESWQRTLTRPAVSYLVRHSDAWASYGTASAAYLVDLGAAPERVVPAYHCIDNVSFLAGCQRTRGRVAAERAALGLGERAVVLFVGRMLARKGGDDLIDAFARICGQRDDLALLMIGEGPLRGEWEARAARSGACVRFLGARPLDELPLYYQLADLFVLPSLEEVWGLVVNEAALAGLPLVVSDRCGAAPDLVEPGVNGHRVPAGDVPALATAMADILGDRQRARQMGAESRRIVERCTPAKVAAALARAVALASR